MEITESWHDVYNLMSWWKSEVVDEAKVLVVGAGALGNEVLKNMSLMGVGHIYVIDMDTIEYSNLSRSVLFRESDAKDGRYKSEVVAERVREINKNVKCTPLNGDVGYDVGLGLLRQMDVVIGCLDNRLARLMTNRNCLKVGVPWIDGGIQNLSGQVRLYSREGNCYECNLQDLEMNALNFRMGCPDLAQQDIKAGRVPTTPISSSIIGAIQVQEALKVIHEFKEESINNQVFTYEGMFLDTGLYEYGETKDECLSHDYIDEVVEIDGLTIDLSFNEVFEKLEEEFKSDDINIILRNAFVTKVASEDKNYYKVGTPLSKLSDYIVKFNLKKTPNERIFIIDKVEEVNKETDAGMLAKPLKALSIPHDEILMVEVGADIHYVAFA